MLREFKFDCESSKLLLVLGQNSSLFFDKFWVEEEKNWILSIEVKPRLRLRLRLRSSKPRSQDKYFYDNRKRRRNVNLEFYWISFFLFFFWIRMKVKSNKMVKDWKVFFKGMKSIWFLRAIGRQPMWKNVPLMILWNEVSRDTSWHSLPWCSILLNRFLHLIVWQFNA